MIIEEVRARTGYKRISTFHLVSKASATHSRLTPLRSTTDRLMGLVILLPMGSTGPSGWSGVMTVSSGLAALVT